MQTQIDIQDEIIVDNWTGTILTVEIAGETRCK